MGMAVKVDKGDETCCTVVANVMEGTLAEKLIFRRVQGIFLSDNTMSLNTIYNCVEFNKNVFDQVIETLISRTNCVPIEIIVAQRD